MEIGGTDKELFKPPPPQNILESNEVVFGNFMIIAVYFLFVDTFIYIFFQNDNMWMERFRNYHCLA